MMSSQPVRAIAQVSMDFSKYGTRKNVWYTIISDIEDGLSTYYTDWVPKGNPGGRDNT